MKVEIFGRKDCSVCGGIKDKFTLFLERWGVAGSVVVEYHDTETVDGLSKMMQRGCRDVPAVVILDYGGQVVVTWQGRPIESKEFKPYFEHLKKTLPNAVPEKNNA